MLLPRTVRDHADVASHFDEAARAYQEAHGDAGRLLQYRLEVIRSAWRALCPRSSPLLEIGCGPGTHLLQLRAGFSRAIGLDLSPAMIRIANRDPVSDPDCPTEFRVDRAEELATVADATIGAVLCVGALEHMLDRGRVLQQVGRVLQPGGVFVCLTHNGDSLWYARLAPWLGLETRHLSTDRSLRRRELEALVVGAGLRVERVAPWTFVARGDMPRRWGIAMSWADRLGRLLRLTSLRGGLAVTAVKPEQPARR